MPEGELTPLRCGAVSCAGSQRPAFFSYRLLPLGPAPASAFSRGTTDVQGVLWYRSRAVTIRDPPGAPVGALRLAGRRDLP